MVDPTKEYYLSFSDQEEFKVTSDFVVLSKTFTNLLEDIDSSTEEKILLPCSNNWSNESYKKLYQSFNILISIEPDYFEKQAQNKDYNSPDNRTLSSTEQHLKFTPEEYPILFEMISVANFLDMVTFIQLLAKYIAHKINEARLSDNDQDILNLLGNPDMELDAEEQQFLEDKKAVLENLKQNETVSM